MHILSIETSCDETAAAVVAFEEDNGSVKVLSNVVSSQVSLHAAWGGVVPNLAAREHLKNILPIIGTSLKEAGIRPDGIDLIAVTNGPGLIPALLVGTTVAKTIAYLWEKPLVGIHHIEGHIYANFIRNEISKNPKDLFPILCLVVSGGHTQLVLMKDHLQYEIVGETQDDAVGEAFDKVARIIGLGYPGGPAIAKEAAKFENAPDRSASQTIRFPRPMIGSQDLDFSFSGLKTAVLYLVKKNEDRLKDSGFIQQVAFEFQEAAIEVLVAKTIAAAKAYGPKSIMLAGGVSANAKLQEKLRKAIESELTGVRYDMLDNAYSLDNAAMIGAAAAFRASKEGLRKEWLTNWRDLRTEANLKLQKNDARH